MEEFERAPDAQGFTPSGYAWASWYNGEGPDVVHVSVHWKPARSPKHEPPFEIVKWNRKQGRLAT